MSLVRFELFVLETKADDTPASPLRGRQVSGRLERTPIATQLPRAIVRSSTFRLDQPRPTGFPFIQAGNRQGDHTTMFKEPV